MEDVLKMAGHFSAHAIGSVAIGETLFPILGYLGIDQRTSMERLDMDSAAAFALAEMRLSSPGVDKQGVAFIRDAVVGLETGKTDALVVDVTAADRIESRLQVIIPYRHAKHPAGFAVHCLQVTQADGIPRDDIQRLMNAFVAGIDSHAQGGKLYRERYEKEAAATAGGYAEQNTAFNHEEFELLKRSPVLIFLLVAAADGVVDEKELRRFVEGLLDPSLLKQRLLSRIVTNMIGEASTMIIEMASSESDFLSELRTIRSIIDDKLPAAEGTAFKQALLFLANRIASASGGFFGFGKVGREEKNALQAIATSLGITSS